MYSNKPSLMSSTDSITHVGSFMASLVDCPFTKVSLFLTAIVSLIVV